MKPVYHFDKRSIIQAGRKRLIVSAASNDVQGLCRCGFSLSLYESSSISNKSSISYCKHCGLVSSNTAGIVVKEDRQNLDLVQEQPSIDKSTSSLPVSRHEPAEKLSRLWISYSKASDQTQKNFALALAEITRLVQALSLQSTLASQAADICMMAFEKGLTKGTCLSVLSAAIIYATARLASLPITIDEVTAATKSDKSELIHCFRKLQRKLGLTFEVLSPEDFLNKIIAILSIPSDSKLVITAKKIIGLADEKGMMMGKNPSAVAAAAIYLASYRADNSCSSSLNHQLTQRKLAEVANVTETTIRRACRYIQQLL